MKTLQYKIPPEHAKVILSDAMECARRIFVDELDCSKSFRRVPSDKTPQEILDMGLNDSKTKYHCILRDLSFLPQEFKDNDGRNPNRNYWDVGLSTIGMTPEYFLWIELEEYVGYEFVKARKLIAI